MNEELLRTFIIPFLLEEVKRASEELHQPVYIVGGYVRDLLLGRGQKDIDLVTVGSGIELAEKVAQKLGVEVNIFKNFGTAMLKYNGIELEFVSTKNEVKGGSRNPIITNGTLEDNLSRRDFTINSMAINIQTGDLIDLFGGRKDIEQKVLKTPIDPNITFGDDPLRMMRAVRFAMQLGFEIDKPVLEAMQKNAGLIGTIAKERIVAELNKIIEAKKPSIGFKILFDTGILHHILHEVASTQRELHPFVGNYFHHTLQVLDNIAQASDNLWLRWAVLLHAIEDVDEQKIFNIFKRLTLPLDEKLEYVQKIVRLQKSVSRIQEGIIEGAVRRILFEAGNDIDDIITFCKCNISTFDIRELELHFKKFEYIKNRIGKIEDADKLKNWQDPISGEVIMKTFNLNPCPQIGMIKKAIREAIIDGHIKNDYQDALWFMKHYVKNHLNHGQLWEYIKE
jgi:tRNA nucleotidyltransferase/poly(A) polymerase